MIAPSALARLKSCLVLLAAALAASQAAAAAENGVRFLDPLTNEPLAVPQEDASAAVRQFRASGENPYAGDEAAIVQGKQLYARWCQACHLPDGTGRIGPNLVDGTWKYARTATVQGKFEIIYAGGAGAMQSFKDRLSQDEILKVVAYLERLAAQD